jgi:hypothetical protein
MMMLVGQVKNEDAKDQTLKSKKKSIPHKPHKPHPPQKKIKVKEKLGRVLGACCNSSLAE